MNCTCTAPGCYSCRICWCSFIISLFPHLNDVSCNLQSASFLCYSRTNLFFLSIDLKIYSIIPSTPWKLQNFPFEEINARCEARPNCGGGNKMNHASSLGSSEEQSCVWLMPEETLLHDKTVEHFLETFLTLKIKTLLTQETMRPRGLCYHAIPYHTTRYH